MITEFNKPNRRTLTGIYTDLKVVLDMIFDIEKKKIFPDFHPEGISEDEEELLEQLYDYETLLIGKAAEEKGLYKHRIDN